MHLSRDPHDLFDRVDVFETDLSSDSSDGDEEDLVLSFNGEEASAEEGPQPKADTGDPRERSDTKHQGKGTQVLVS